MGTSRRRPAGLPITYVLFGNIGKEISSFLALCMSLGPAIEQKELFLLPKCVASDHSVGQITQFQEKFSSIGTIEYFMAMISHSGVDLLTCFFLLSFQTLDFPN